VGQGLHTGTTATPSGPALGPISGLVHDVAGVVADIEAGVFDTLASVGTKLIDDATKLIPGRSGVADAMRDYPPKIWSAFLSWVTAHAPASPSTGNPPGGLTNATGSLPGNWKAIVTYLVGHGFTKQEAAGVAGNIFAESGGNPNIWETGGGGGYGLIQWTPPPAGLVGSGLYGELAQIVREGTGMFSNPSTAAAAAYQYLVGRERPADPGATAALREASANAVYKAAGYDSGGWLQPGPTMVLNSTGRPEAVLTGDQWDMLSSASSGWDIGDKLDRIANLLAAQPRATASGVGDALNGTARMASLRARYPRNN
jgi:hypothetical protein